MEFIKPNTNIDFIGKRNYAYGFSGVLIVITLLALLFQGGVKYGVDFAGGTLIQVRFSGAVTVSAIEKGFEGIGISKPQIQTITDAGHSEYLVRTEKPVQTNEQFSNQVEKALKDSTGQDAEIRRIEMVGPQVGKDLREKALFAIFYSLLFIAVYISGRFEFKWFQSAIIAAVLMGAVYGLELLGVGMAYVVPVALIVTLVLFWYFDLRYAMGAIVALIHDVTITIGCFALTGKEFSLPIIAALLTIIGYSLNDTIIVFDRIRENAKKFRKLPFDALINQSVNNTLSRTILTAGTTLVAVLALFVLGGSIIHDFAFAMLVGIVIGTYSSIYIASPILMAFQGIGKRK